MPNRTWNIRIDWRVKKKTEMENIFRVEENITNRVWMRAVGDVQTPQSLYFHAFFLSSVTLPSHARLVCCTEQLLLPDSGRQRLLRSLTLCGKLAVGGHALWQCQEKARRAGVQTCSVPANGTGASPSIWPFWSRAPALEVGSHQTASRLEWNRTGSDLVPQGLLPLDQI